MKRGNGKFVIECCRAGVIGDVLMTTPAIRELRKQYKNAHIRYVTLNPDLLINNPNIDELSIVNYPCDLQIKFEYPVHKGYPDKPLTKHIAAEFAECGGVQIDSFRGDIYFSESELIYAESVIKKFEHIPTATIHIHGGWSPYKNWPFENWQKVVDHFFKRIVFIQIGGPNDPVLNNVISMVRTFSIRLSSAFIYSTDFFIGIDSFPNHVAGALSKPAVVLFGSTSPTGSGYPSATNIWTGEECSPCYREYNSISVHKKPPCPYDIKCMKGISVERVVHSIEEELDTIKL